MQAGREIKFRAWDTVQDKMLPVESINFRNDVISLDEGDNSVSDSSDMFILMQFTGLLDKNGKEIYEGDIVRLNDCGDIFDHIVRWSDVDAQFLFEVNGDWYGAADMEFDQCVIAGNIYENAELLEAI